MVTVQFLANRYNSIMPKLATDIFQSLSWVGIYVSINCVCNINSNTKPNPNPNLNQKCVYLFIKYIIFYRYRCYSYIIFLNIQNSVTFHLIDTYRHAQLEL